VPRAHASAMAELGDLLEALVKFTTECANIDLVCRQKRVVLSDQQFDECEIDHFLVHPRDFLDDAQRRPFSFAAPFVLPPSLQGTPPSQQTRCACRSVCS